MDNVVIVSAKRSAFGRYGGTLSDMNPLDLAVQVAKQVLVIENREAAEQVEQVFVGNCIQSSFESASTVGRQISLGLGLDVFTTTIDTACCSPLTCLRLGTQAIRSGEIDTALVVGVELMSQTPHVVRNVRKGVRIGKVEMIDPIFPIEYKGYSSVAVDASDGAERCGISKNMLDTWSLGSHRKWVEASENGRFDDEIVPVTARDGRRTVVFKTDEFPRPTATLAKIEMLPPIFGSRLITAGNAPGLNDGASAAVIMSEEKARREGYPILGRIIAAGGVTDSPDGIAWVPAGAIRKVIELSGVDLDDIDLVEINEAFAAMPLVSTRILAGDDEDAWLKLLEKTNVNGGAIAIGHPVGASGLRILMTMMYELRRRNGGCGVASICGGLAQGEAVLLENPDKK